jgi:TolB-like protein
MASEDDSADRPPSPDEIRAELDRMVGSDVFRNSAQLVAFLRYVVESVLQAKQDRIKAYTIGVEVFRRNTKFDPQIDPIVRVEATRLRRTIERYYAGPGLADPVVIDFPRGSYVPTFRLRRGDTNSPALLRARLAGVRRRAIVGAAVVGIAGILGVAAWVWSSRHASLSEPASRHAATDDTISGTLRPGNGLPTLLVQPFEITGTPDPRGISAASLHDRIGDAFARFDLINIIWESMLSGTDAGRVASRSRLPIDYRLVGTVEYYMPGAVRIQFQLLDATDESVVWSRLFEEHSEDREPKGSEEAIIRELSNTLAQPFGVVYAYGRRQADTRGIGDPRYRCLLQTIESFRSFDSDQTAQARTCLARLTAIDPAFGLGWSYLAALYVREYYYGLGVGETGDPPPLQRALRAAQRGVELNPAGARAHEMLFTVLFAEHDLPAAFAVGAKAMSLNKYDMRTVGAYGARKIAVGEIDEGMKLLQQAAGDGTVVPAFEQFFQFLGSYMRDDIDGASFHAGQLTGDAFQLGLMARALNAFAKHDRDVAQSALDRLAASNPVWRQNPRAELEKFFYADAIVDRLARDLQAAGLKSPN